MAVEEIAFKVTTDTGQTENSVKSIKTQLKEANIELIKAQENFGDYSAEALKAAQNVAKLKDQVTEARETVDLFDPGKKFQAFSGVLQTTAAGYAGLQGAIGLFGTESAELEKQLLKVQSALALSEGLSAVKDGAKDFARLGAIVKTQVVTAFSTLKGAIIATGIGALVVGVGLLIANFEAVKKVVLNFIPGLAKVGEFIGKLVDQITDFVGATSEASRAYDKLAKTNKSANEEIDRRIKLLQAQGGKEAEIAKLSKQNAENDLNTLRAKLKSEGRLNEEELKQFRDLKNEKSVIDAQETTRQKTELDKRTADRKTAFDKQEADRKANEEKIKKEFDDYIKRLQAEDAAKKAQKDFEIELEASAVADFTAIDEANAEVKLEKEQALAEREINSADFLARLNRENNAKKLQDDKTTYEARLVAQDAFLMASASVFGQLSMLFEEGTAASKAAGIAEIAIQTGVGFANGLRIAQESAKATGPAAAFAFPVFYATQIGAVLAAVGKARSILSKVKGGGSSGGGVSRPSSGGGASGGNFNAAIPAQAPIQSGVPIQQTQAVGTANVNVQNQQTIKAYVVERDITDSQDRISKIKAAATI